MDGLQCLDGPTGCAGPVEMRWPGYGDESRPRCERHHDEPRLECLEGPEGCAGPVELRWPGYGSHCWPRCELHGDARVKREEEAIERYGNPDSPCIPEDFDPSYAGERWDED
jgi:hypothetical protein